MHAGVVYLGIAYLLLLWLPHMLACEDMTVDICCDQVLPRTWGAMLLLAGGRGQHPQPGVPVYRSHCQEGEPGTAGGRLHREAHPS